MSQTVLLTATLLLCLVILAITLIFLLRSLTRMSQDQKEVSLAQTTLVSKLATLIASGDPLTYQAIQAMEPDQKSPSSINSVFSSDELEEFVPEDPEKLLTRFQNGEDLNAAELGWIEKKLGGAFEYEDF